MPTNGRMSGLRALLLVLLPLSGCHLSAPAPASAPAGELGTPAHAELVMHSSFCADCHPAIYAEHEANTHGLAFKDTETRLATHNFRREDCVRCHTPRPVFETGIGMTPMQRWTNLEEGNTCMSCHWKKGVDYARFTGGAQCKTSFDPRVGEVEACASCHRIAGTPDQWSRAEQGHKAGRVCIDCHMPLVERPVALGEPPRQVHAHVFPASHSEKQLRRAYAWTAAVEGSELVVRITNKGAGHNFPTATRQRALESLVIVRDAQGNELGRSRLSCTYPYASELEPGQLTMPVSTQIPSGKTREHRVPLPVASGTVECSLYFKIYRPAADSDPELARVLETATLPFDGVTPSTAPIADPPRTGSPAPAASVEEFFDPAGFCNVARPEPKPGPIEIPEGRTHEERLRLVALLEFHMPEARRLAHEKLRALGVSALPELVRGLGAWSNETFNQAQEIVAEIGAPALPALREALRSPELYVRCHARFVIARIGLDAAGVGRAARPPQQRRGARDAARRGRGRAAPRPALRHRSGRGQRRGAGARAPRRAHGPARAARGPRAGAVARAAARPRGRPVRARRSGRSAAAPRWARRARRRAARKLLRAALRRHGPLLRLRPGCAAAGAARSARAAAGVLDRRRRRALAAPGARGRSAPLRAHARDGARTRRGLGHGRPWRQRDARGRARGPHWQKRQLACEALARIGAKDAAPFLAAALRDPAPPVCEAACAALASAGDPAVLPQLSTYEGHVRGWRLDPARAAQVERLLAGAARTRLALGDERASQDLEALRFSADPAAREIAIRALR